MQGLRWPGGVEHDGPHRVRHSAVLSAVRVRCAADRSVVIVSPNCSRERAGSSLSSSQQIHSVEAIGWCHVGAKQAEEMQLRPRAGVLVDAWQRDRLRPVRSISRLLPALITAVVVFAAGASAASAKTTWLRLPGVSPDPCTPGLSTTVYSPTGAQLSVQHPKRLTHPAIDCLYVYPTVSGQTTTLSSFAIDPVERSIALSQAARYSQYRRVFAPIYRQMTLTAVLAGNRETPAQLAVPLDDVRSAFRDYLSRYNHGRGFRARPGDARNGCGPGLAVGPVRRSATAGDGASASPGPEHAHDIHPRPA